MGHADENEDDRVKIRLLTHIFLVCLRRRVKKNQFELRRKVKAFSCVQHDLYDDLKINVK